MAAFDLPLNSPALYSLLSPSTRAVKKMPGGAAELSTSTAFGPSHTRPSVATSIESAQSATSPVLLAGGAGSASASAPTDVLLTLPPPLLRLLVISAPFVRTLTTLSQLLTWTHPNRYAPFLLLFGWTATCLGGELVLRFGFNALLLAVLGLGWVAKRGGKVYTAQNIRHQQQQQQMADGSGTTNITGSGTSQPQQQVRTLSIATSTQPAVQVLTPTALEALLHRASILSKHLQVLQAGLLAPALRPFDWRDPSLSMATINLLLSSYPFYLLLTYFVPLRHIVLAVGLVALTWEAPWLAVVRKSLWSSLLVRRTARVALRIIQGDLRLAQAEVREGPENVGILARLRGARTLAFDMQVGKSRGVSPARAVTGTKTDSIAPEAAKEAESLEIQYMFTIFENQVCVHPLMVDAASADDHGITFSAGGSGSSGRRRFYRTSVQAGRTLRMRPPCHLVHSRFRLLQAQASMVSFGHIPGSGSTLNGGYAAQRAS